MTRLQQSSYRISLPAAASGTGVTPVAPSASSRSGSWLLRFLLGLIITVAGSYWLMEALGLRFCQPFHNERVYCKVHFFQTEVDGAEIVYLGNSQVFQDIMPAVVEDEARGTGVTPVAPLGRGYNMGIGGASLELCHIITRDVLHGSKRPRVLVVGVWPLMLGTGGHSKVQLVADFGSLTDIAEHVQTGDLSPIDLASAPFRGLENLLQYPVYQLKGPSTKRRSWEHLRKSQGAYSLPEEAHGFHDKWNAPDWDTATDRLETNLRGGYHMGFHDDTPSARTLRSLRDVARERGMNLVVIYLPQHPDFSKRVYSPGTENRARLWMADFCRREGITYHDLHEADRYEQTDFADLTHLNPRGAEKFSRRLASVLIGHFLPSANERGGYALP